VNETRAVARVRWSALIFIALLAIAIARIASTYSVFNHTFDEIGHLGPAMEWLDNGTYNYEPQHPPMRAVYAIGPRLLGIHHFEVAHWGEAGAHILYEGGNYWRNLTAARIAALPFFALALLLVFLWTRRLAGPPAALVATLAYSTLPLALGHAGVVANDTLVTGTLTLALFALAHWLARPGFGRALLFGLAAGAAVISKFSALLFLLAVVGATGLLWLLRMKGSGRDEAPPETRARVLQGVAAVALATLAACVLIWSAYRFSFGPLTDPYSRPHHTLDRIVGAAGPVHDLAYRITAAPVPAPEFWTGIQTLRIYNMFPPASYLMGEISEHGFKAFFTIGILVKTPIPFLLLMFGGMVVLLRRGWRDDDPFALLPPLAAVLIVVACLSAGLNIGVRHVLPVFPLFAIGIGVFSSYVWRATSGPMGARALATRTLLVALFAWQVSSGVRVHPDYLAYFNECCSAEPQRWLVNSDLDWGQDLQRLSLELRKRKIDRIHLAYFGAVEIDRHGLPPHDSLQPYQRVHGWVAASEFRLAMGDYTRPYDQFAWLLEYRPVAQVGKSIRLYYIP
jgi:hypothetical protein